MGSLGSGVIGPKQGGLEDAQGVNPAKWAPWGSSSFLRTSCTVPPVSDGPSVISGLMSFGGMAEHCGQHCAGPGVVA